MSAADIQRSVLRYTLSTRREARCRARSRSRSRAACLAVWQLEETELPDLIVVGDSIAAGFPLDLLAPATYRVLNRGWPGETISELDSRIAESLNRVPRAIAIHVGTNDVLRGVDALRIGADHRALLTRCRAALPLSRIVVIGLPPIAAWRADPRTVEVVNGMLSANATPAEVVFVDTIRALDRGSRSAPRPMKRDGVHLTITGYELLADHVRTALWQGERS